MKILHFDHLDLKTSPYKHLYVDWSYDVFIGEMYRQCNGCCGALIAAAPILKKTLRQMDCGITYEIHQISDPDPKEDKDWDYRTIVMDDQYKLVIKLSKML